MNIKQAKNILNDYEHPISIKKITGNFIKIKDNNLNSTPEILTTQLFKEYTPEEFTRLIEDCIMDWTE